MSKRTLMALYLALFLCTFWFQVVQAAPSNLTYQGRILKSDGTPLEYGNTSFLFEITSPNGNCVIFREQRDGVSMLNSKGVFDVPIGSGTKLFPTDPLFTLLDSFNNSKVHNCFGGATYNAGTGDVRLLKVQFHDGNGWKVISPANEIRTVPYSAYALSAEKLGTNTADEFLLKAGLPTCDPNEFLIWNGTALDCLPVSGASGGTVTQVSSASSPYLTVTNGNSTPGISLSVGTGPGTLAAGDDARFTNARTPSGAASGDLTDNYPNPKVVKIQGQTVSATAPTAGQVLIFDSAAYTPTSLSGDATLSATGVVTLKNTGTTGTYAKVTTDAQGRVTSGTGLAASDIPNLDWNKITSGKPTTLAGFGITDSVLNAGNTPSIQAGTLALRPTAGTAGRLYVVTDDNSLFRDNGSAWVEVGDGSGTSGVTTVTAAAPLSSSGGLTPQITISQANTSTNGFLSSTDWNTFNSKLGTASSFSGDISGTASTISVDAIKGKAVSPAAYAIGQTLRYSGTEWINSLLGFSDLSGSVSTAQLPVVPVSKGGTGTNTLTPNRLMASDGTGASLVPFTCALGQLITFDSGGIMGCTSYSTSGLFANGGNSFGTTTTLGTNDGQSLNFETSGTTKMTILTTGEVGIGTESPTNPLEVQANATLSKGLLMKNTNNAGGAHLSVTAGTTSLTMGTWGSAAGGTTTYIESNSSNPFKIETFSNTPITFATNKSGGTPERMRIDTAGNVGIGTAAPSSKLHVTSDAASPPLVLFRASLEPSPTAHITANLHANWSTIALNSSYNFTGSLYGAVSRIETSAGQTGSINALMGSTNDVLHKSAAPVTNAVGSQGNVQNTSGGAISTAKAANFSILNSGGGSIGTAYGVFIGPVEGTTKYGLYQEYATVPNYLAGNTGVGTNNPYAKLHVEGNAFVKNKLFLYDNSAWGSVTPGVSLALGDDDTGLEWVTDGVFQIYNNGQPRVHFASNGMVGIGTTTPGYKLDVNGNLRAFGITDSSDLRLKRDIASLSSAEQLERLLKVQGVSYNWKNPEHGKRLQLGFIAQELEKHYPELVETDDQGMKSVNYSHLVAPLVEAVKALYGEITSLKEAMTEKDQRIAALEQDKAQKDQELAELKARMDRLEKALLKDSK